MRGLFGALLALAATALLVAPASAHHSQAMFDTSREVLFDGTLVRFGWVNPHMYLIIETKGPDGDHRSDLDFSPASEACDPKEAARYRESVPK
jgi:hypothetical protein